MPHLPGRFLSLWATRRRLDLISARDQAVRLRCRQLFPRKRLRLIDKGVEKVARAGTSRSQSAGGVLQFAGGAGARPALREIEVLQRRNEVQNLGGGGGGRPANEVTE